MRLELLSPAKNLEQGREAINHGADAVYIGAPAFGARVAAGNSIGEIERLARYAHTYHARVYATVNTLLFDNEIDAAVGLLHQLYDAGVDAAIIQDLGLLECDLPPIELHASTQTHNATPERIKFMEQVGFSRVILARETSLEQMEALRRQTSVELEAFVQGALCVSYSGQCYLSQYINGRSGNRGCCSQPCRSAYDLFDEQGNLIRRGQHLLSLKDFSAARHLQRMAAAGISSFKIEGRLKDMAYVKNVTAFYRQLLDNLMAHDGQYWPASSGKCTFFFTPDPEKTFNRGFTDFFLRERQPMATLVTQKSIGKRLGKVTRLTSDSITIATRESFTPGDGLCFFSPQGTLEGFQVNRVQGNTIQPNRMPDGITEGTLLWRNNDQAFERQLQGRTAERKIDVDIILSDTPDGVTLHVEDADGCTAEVFMACAKEPANNPDRVLAQMERQIGKTGDTPFRMARFECRCAQPWFLPAALLNDLRRQSLAQLEEARIADHLSRRHQSLSLAERLANTTPYFETTVDYRANILNAHAEQFYRRHGVQGLEYGLEKTGDFGDKSLMTTKYCIRYELGLCLRQHPAYTGPLYLRNNKNTFLLTFDCSRCQMQLQLQ